MEITNQITDKAILDEIGRRLERERLNRNLIRKDLAEKAGVSRATVERLESGESIQFSNLIRVCRALGLLGRFDAAFPASPISPIAQLKRQGKERRRASTKSKQVPQTKWTWGNDE